MNEVECLVLSLVNERQGQTIKSLVKSPVLIRKT